jgi:hypothetical protein
MVDIYNKNNKMSKKIVRLTESDLVRLVKRVVKEQSIDEQWDNPHELEKLKGTDGKIDLDKFDAYMEKFPPKAPTREPKNGPFASAGEDWYDSSDIRVKEPTNYSEEKTFGPNDYDSFMKFINNCDTKWCMQTKKMYDVYAKKPKGIRVRK